MAEYIAMWYNTLTISDKVLLCEYFSYRFLYRLSIHPEEYKGLNITVDTITKHILRCKIYIQSNYTVITPSLAPCT